jgi:hypothetical protein
MELKVSAWMQDKTLSEAFFMDEYHRALKNIALDSEKILQKLLKDAEIPGSATKTLANDPLLQTLTLPKSKKM